MNLEEQKEESYRNRDLILDVMSDNVVWFWNTHLFQNNVQTSQEFREVGDMEKAPSPI